ncbi:MAG: radical SAM protein, partial [Actinobacteria bacterium]|nr:radical SAM protein [Actinomycetota bacterium]
MASRFYVETLGCPKNEVDSEKLVGTLLAQGLTATDDESQADVVVVNTCAFIEEARKESIDTIMALSERRKKGARLVVTGCMAERYGDELRANLPEADQIAGFGVAIATGVAPAAAAASGSTATASTTAVTLGKKPSLVVASETVPSFDLLNLPRPKSREPWAYVKIAEGCDRNCGFCAIPSFRGPQRSRDIDSILREVDELQAKEIVLVAQDLASYGKDRPGELGAGSIVPLVRAVSA